ncbi:MAG: protease modulator HflC [Gammaproteobacteria bacterium]|jgi:membrane protease subunit HflC|nr:protease modulator HflC [Gammaproteobacteria bacterium]
MNFKRYGILAVILGIVLLLSIYTVDQREKGLLLRLGEIQNANIGPGLHFKMPFINNVLLFDARILTLDAQPESFLTSEKKNVTVDFFVKWRILDTAQYYRSTRGEERNAMARLAQIIKDRLRNEFGKRTIKQAVSGERGEIMEILQDSANTVAKDLGIAVVDVRISRIDLPDKVSASVYERMRSERERVAREFRARGMESSERIRATADRERTVILANAYRDAELIRGDGDAKSAEIYAKAYNANPEFYAFTRSLNAYTSTFNDRSDMLVLEPDSDFFRYFNSLSGGKPTP